MTIDLISRSRAGLPADPVGASMPLPAARLVLHHQAGEDNGRSTWRYIYSFHTGPERDWWDDIGYQWGYSPLAREFYVGRGPGVRGAHVAGLNYRSHGLCVLGDYDDDELPTHAVADLADFARWHGERGYGPSEFTHGHRDLGSTSCPGANLYPRIRDINALAKAPYTTEETEMKRLIHVGERGGTAYELVDHPWRRGRYALRPVPSSAVAKAITGDDDWGKHTVIMDEKDAAKLKVVS